MYAISTSNEIGKRNRGKADVTTVRLARVTLVGWVMITGGAAAVAVAAGDAYLGGAWPFLIVFGGIALIYAGLAKWLAPVNEARDAEPPADPPETTNDTPGGV
jgi:predicted phage tail protein